MRTLVFLKFLLDCIFSDSHVITEKLLWAAIQCSIFTQIVLNVLFLKILLSVEKKRILEYRNVKLQIISHVNVNGTL